MLFNDHEARRLMNSLLKHDFDRLIKTAQGMDIARGNLVLLDIAEKLLNAMPISDIYAGRPDAELFLKDATNLDALLFFLQTKEFKYGDKLLVYPGIAQGIGGSQFVPDLKIYLPYPNETNPQYYVYKDGLIAYLHDLEAKLGDDAFGKKKLSDLIQEVQTKLHITVPPAGSMEVHYPTAEEAAKKQEAGPDNTFAIPESAVSEQKSSLHSQLTMEQRNQLDQVLGSFPLHTDHINLQEIMAWADRWAQVATSIRGGASQLAIEAVRTITPALQNLISHYHNLNFIPLPSDAQAMIGLVHTALAGFSVNPRYEALQFVAALIGVMNNIRAMLLNIKDIMPDLPKPILDALNRQVGSGYSIWQQNYSDLQDLYRQLGGR
jgi:hypothetical protein